jgi:hypothetical protein
MTTKSKPKFRVRAAAIKFCISQEKILLLEHEYFPYISDEAKFEDPALIVTVIVRSVLHAVDVFVLIVRMKGPPLWSSAQSSYLPIQRFQVRFPALPDFLRSSGSGTRSTQPREDNGRAT